MEKFIYTTRRDGVRNQIPIDTQIRAVDIHTPNNQPVLPTTKRLPLHDLHQDFKSIAQVLPPFINNPNYSSPTLYDIIIEACDFYAEQIKCNSSHSLFYNNTNLFLDEIRSSCKLLKEQMEEKAKETKNQLIEVKEEEKNLSIQISEIMQNLEVLYKTNPDEIEYDERIALTDSMIKELEDAKDRNFSVNNMDTDEDYVTMLPLENEYQGIKGKLANKRMEKASNLIEYAQSAIEVVMAKKASNGFSALDEFYNYMPLLQMDPMNIMRDAKRHGI
ncbi:hypothetical protein SteCoe_6147 [Stentor coeruleus]|uniref:Uncharacterized protein n=1 Tax=Stentor coeruleus TaxID=5963 RepID=A0A1R2CQS3_9CILI|nr:hypothetical protein SteCoe_6147 [Stentor coeruleus]